jgi:hypothetical protein
MAYTTGEYIDKFILPQLVQVLRNMKMDFMSVIQTAPEAAISKAGIIVHKIGAPISVDWDKATAYVDGDIKAFEIENETIPWQYLSTTPFSTNKEEIRTSALDRKGKLFEDSAAAISESWTARTLRNIAPDDASVTAMPVLRTTGADRGDGTGAKRLTIVDLIKWKEKLNKLQLSRPDQLYVVLCPEHLTDLAIDALNYQNFKDIYVNTANGEAIPQYGMKFFWNQETVYYTTGSVKKAKGASLISTDRPSSIGIYAPHTVKALYSLTSHYKAMADDTRNNPPKDEGRFTGNAIGTKFYNYGHSAMISGIV